MRAYALVFCAAAASACASSSQAGPESAASEATVEFVVINRTSGPVTAFAQWRNGPRTVLGEVASRGTRRFATPFRSGEVALSLNVLAAPSVGTVAGPPTFSPDGGSPRASSDAPRTYATIQAGETVEWEITSTYPSVQVQYRRLTTPN